MAKQCEADNCEYNQFGGGYCPNHQYLRTDGKKPKQIKSTGIKRSNTPIRRTPIKVGENRTTKNQVLIKRSYIKKGKGYNRNSKPISKISKSQSRKNTLYENAKREIREQLLSTNSFRCYFTDIELPDNYNKFHHILGRDGDLTFDKKWIVPALDIPHLEYHDHDVIYLLSKTEWYPKFIMRLYFDNDYRFYHEMKRIRESKAGKANYLKAFFGSSALGMLTKKEYVVFNPYKNAKINIL